MEHVKSLVSSCHSLDEVHFGPGVWCVPPRRRTVGTRTHRDGRGVRRRRPRIPLTTASSPGVRSAWGVRWSLGRRGVSSVTGSSALRRRVLDSAATPGLLLSSRLLYEN